MKAPKHLISVPSTWSKGPLVFFDFTETASIASHWIKAIITLYRIGFRPVSKVSPVHCELHVAVQRSFQSVPSEQKPYPSYNLQRSLLIWKDHLPIRDFAAISALVKVFRLGSERFKNLSDTEHFTFNSGAEQYCSGTETAQKAAFLV